MAYVIWTCCGFEEEDTRGEAIGMAVAIMQGDGPHSVTAVTGPDGEDLMPAAEEADRVRSEEYMARREASPPVLGRVEVEDPRGRWVVGAWVYSAEQKVRELDALRARFGESRVRWVEGAA